MLPAGGVRQVPGVQVPLAGRDPGVQAGRDRAAGVAVGQVPRRRQPVAIGAGALDELHDRPSAPSVRPATRGPRRCAGRQLGHRRRAGGVARSARSSQSWYQPATARTWRATSAAVHSPQARRSQPSGPALGSARRTRRRPRRRGGGRWLAEAPASPDSCTGSGRRGGVPQPLVDLDADFPGHHSALTRHPSRWRHRPRSGGVRQHAHPNGRGTRPQPLAELQAGEGQPHADNPDDKRGSDHIDV